MHTSSGIVALTAAGALAVGSIGMASAQSHASHDLGVHRAHDVHAAPGHVGQNRSLAPEKSKGLPKLVGIVNSNRDIEISDRTPGHGKYKIVVHDSTRSHNWHLFGNGESVSTSVRKTGTWKFTVRLKVGKYRVVCDPHYDDMEFDLIVH